MEGLEPPNLSTGCFRGNSTTSCGTLPNSQRKWERSTDLTAPNGALYQLSYTLIMNLFVVGVAGFEPATPCAQSKCSSQTELHADFSRKRRDSNPQIFRPDAFKATPPPVVGRFQKVLVPVEVFETSKPTAPVLQTGVTLQRHRTGIVSSTSWTRTRDHSVNSRTLYQLS